VHVILFLFLLLFLAKRTGVGTKRHHFALIAIKGVDPLYSAVSYGGHVLARPGSHNVTSAGHANDGFAVQRCRCWAGPFCAALLLFIILLLFCARVLGDLDDKFVHLK
jgi:hypothetical protein